MGYPNINSVLDELTLEYAEANLPSLRAYWYLHQVCPKEIKLTTSSAMEGMLQYYIFSDADGKVFEVCVSKSGRPVFNFRRDPEIQILLKTLS